MLSYFLTGGFFVLNISRNHWYILFLLTGFMLFFGNHNIFITDNVESNYALTAKEMLLSGDWISPQIYGQYWFDKPILFYTFTAISYFFFGFTEFASRFFPAIFGLASVALIGWGGKKLYSEKVGFYSAVVLATSFEFLLISKMVITDSLLFFFFSLALLSFLLGYEKKTSKYYYGFYIGSALAVLTKGPIGILLPGLILTVFLLIRRDLKVLKEIKLVMGVLLFSIIALPWYIAMIILHGNNFIDVFLGTHNFLRATVSEHPKDNVFYYYTLVSLLAIFPWAGFIPGIIKKVFINKLKNYKISPKTLFLSLWAGCIFIFFQLMATKYLSYTYPLMFPVAILLGKYFADEFEKINCIKPIVWNSLFYMIVAMGSFWAYKQELLRIESFYYLAGSVIVLLLGNIWIALANNRKNGIMLIALSAFLFNLVLINNVCVPLSQNRSAKNIAYEIQNIPENKNLYVYGDYPTSAVFYSGKRIVKLVPEKELADFKPEGFNWNSKNVMPYGDLESIMQKKDLLVLVNSRDFTKFKNVEIEENWQIAIESNKWLVLEKLSGSFESS